MGFIALKCPSCGSDITLDDSRTYGFCSYCGTKLVQDKQIIELRGSVGIDHSAQIQNYLILARRRAHHHLPIRLLRKEPADRFHGTEQPSTFCAGFHRPVRREDPSGSEHLLIVLYRLKRGCQISMKMTFSSRDRRMSYVDREKTANKETFCPL